MIYTNCRVDWGADRLLLEFLDEGGTFLDVGANIGYYATLVAPRVRRVVAFEPDSHNLDALKRNLSELPNADHVAKAGCAETGSAAFRPGPTAETGHLVPEAGQGQGAHEVETITLDRWRQDNPSDEVSAIKIDVEGFELDVLLGAREMIHDHSSLILQYRPRMRKRRGGSHRFRRRSWLCYLRLPAHKSGAPCVPPPGPR